MTQRSEFMRRLEEIELRPLEAGAHSTLDRGLCVMEAVAYVAGEAHTDKPQCVSLVISAFLRAWNDSLPSDAERDRLLKPLIARVLNSRSTSEVEQRRSWLAVDWLIRTFTPTWFALRPDLREHVTRLRAQGEVRDHCSLAKAQPVLDAARAAAWTVDAIRAAGDAGDAASDAIRDAAGTGAVDASWTVTGDAACDAIRDAAAWDAAWAAWDVAWDAGGDALAQTVDKLQQSALDLVERMIKVE